MIHDEELVRDLVKNIKTVQKSLRSQVHDHFKDLGLTGPQGMLLYMLMKNGPLKISALSKQMGLSNSTVSGIVDRLEVNGHVERHRSEKDRRVVNVSVTEVVKEKMDSHKNVIDSVVSDALNKATKEEFKTISEGLSMLNKLLETTDKGETYHG